MKNAPLVPSWGQDSIEAGKIACIVAFVGVLVFMFLSYGTFGLFANVALILNVGSDLWPFVA